MKQIAIIGAGLAGTEAAYQLSKLGFAVDLYEGKRTSPTPAQISSRMGELVCSNSFKSMDPHSASGQLKWEMQQLDSLFLKAAYASQVPAGSALAVDRDLFSQYLEKEIEKNPKVQVFHQPVDHIESLLDYERIIVATGPLTSEKLSESLMEYLGSDQLAFFDAISPIIDADSIDMTKAFIANRWDKGDEEAYINCPFTKAEYENFIAELKKGRCIEFAEFEKKTPYFQACQPIEKILSTGDESLRFGPMKPTGLIDPRTGERPYAVVQLRPENHEKTSYNMVGFQTKLAYGEQKRIFQMIPGLENAHFFRLGSLHRNTYINSPKALNSYLSKDSKVFFAGQILGVEGYVESAALGILVSNFVAALQRGQLPQLPNEESAIGALYRYLRTEAKNFQPMNINFGVFSPLGQRVRDKKVKYKMIVERARHSFRQWQAAEGQESSNFLSLS